MVSDTTMTFFCYYCGEEKEALSSRSLEHIIPLFCLAVSRTSVVFVANFFGRYENALVVSEDKRFRNMPSGRLLQGVA